MGEVTAARTYLSHRSNQDAKIGPRVANPPPTVGSTPPATIAGCRHRRGHRRAWRRPTTCTVRVALTAVRAAAGLSTTPADRAEPDTFRHDPLNTIPTVGDILASPLLEPDGVQDRSAVEDRTDVLVYTSDVLAKPVSIAGRIELTLFVASSGEDTDVTAALVDVEPSVYTGNVSKGALRLRYRHGGLLTPGQITGVDRRASPDRTHVRRRSSASPGGVQQQFPATCLAASTRGSCRRWARPPMPSSCKRSTTITNRRPAHCACMSWQPCAGRTATSARGA